MQYPHKSQAAAEYINDGAGKKPAESMDIRWQAWHQISGLVRIEKGLGESKDMIKERLLDVQNDFLLETSKIELLEHIHQFLYKGDASKKKDHPGQES